MMNSVFFFTSFTHIFAKVSVHSRYFCLSGFSSLICTALSLPQKSHQLDCKKKPDTMSCSRNMHDETVGDEVTLWAHVHVDPLSGFGSGASRSCMFWGCGIMACMASSSIVFSVVIIDIIVGFHITPRRNWKRNNNLHNLVILLRKKKYH